jgi:hypothetical protein
MFLLIVLCLQAQAPEAPPPDPPAAALGRIRRELERPVSISTDPAEHDADVPVFRVYINERLVKPERLWTDDRLQPWFVQTHFALEHHQFLETVTPDEFRAATLYPIGGDILAVLNRLLDNLELKLRKRAEENARRRVKAELAMLLEARKAAADKEK